MFTDIRGNELLLTTGDKILCVGHMDGQGPYYYNIGQIYTTIKGEYGDYQVVSVVTKDGRKTNATGISGIWEIVNPKIDEDISEWL